MLKDVAKVELWRNRVTLVLHKSRDNPAVSMGFSNAGSNARYHQ